MSDGADDGTKNPECGSTNEDPAAAKNVRHTANDGKSDGRRKGIGKSDPDDVRILLPLVR